jgi:hypothetical protein
MAASEAHLSPGRKVTADAIHRGSPGGYLDTWHRIDVWPDRADTPTVERSIVSMSDHCGMWIPRWPWRLWPGKETFAVLGPRGAPLPWEGPRRFTEQHARLLSQLQSEARADWSRTALMACLEQLRTSRFAEAG